MIADRPEHGPRVAPEGTEFSLWAPHATGRVTLELDDGTIAMTARHDREDRGWWSATVSGVGHGTRYRFRIDDGPPMADPASAWQPDGVHGPSAVVDPREFGEGFEWTDTTWRGLRLDEAVFYELHVGTFTASGTFDGAIAQLDRLAELGVTAIELLPVSAFAGVRNWGYDGVFPYSVQESYGGPVGLARFVDAAHARGLAVLLDVVYNHVGPEGAVHRSYGPYFTEAYRNPWGDAINVDGEDSDAVREYFVGNARRWIRDFHLDGLRLDAVHTVVDASANPFWEDVATAVHDAAAAARRQAVVVGETAEHDPRYVRPADRGLGFDAVWNDDLHHVLAVALLGERHDHLDDFEGTTAELATLFEHRWVYRGQWSRVRRRSHGRPADDVAPRRFVVCFENHDQVGNRPAGDRVVPHTPRRRLAAAVVLLSPFTPLLFMGEEYGETAPFPFFVDHGDERLLRAVRQGRRREFAGADWSGPVPDPGDPATYRSAVLDPTLADREPHRSILAMYTELTRLRREIPTVAGDATQRVTTSGTVVAIDRSAPAGRSVLCVNLADEPAEPRFVDLAGLRLAFDSEDARWGATGAGVVHAGGVVTLGAWTVALFVS